MVSAAGRPISRLAAFNEPGAVMGMAGKENGFTYVEIVVVVIMLGILAAMAIPKVTRSNEGVTSAEGRQTLIALLGAQKRYQLENGVYASDPGLAGGLLDIDIPTSQYFNAPSANNPGGAGIVATVVRTGGQYTLTINNTGTIFCASGTVTCASIQCNKGGGANQCN